MGLASTTLMIYPVVVHKEPQSDYGVSVPDLPECVSAGETLGDALRSAREAIECHIEGLLIDGEGIPPSHGLEAHQAGTKWSGGTWALVQVDLSKLSGKSRRVNITLPERLLTQVDTYASEHGETRSGFLTQAALEYMSRRTET